MDVQRLQLDLTRVRELLVRLHVIFATEYHRILYEVIRIEEKIEAWRREEDNFVQGVLNAVSQDEAFKSDTLVTSEL